MSYFKQKEFKCKCGECKPPIQGETPKRLVEERQDKWVKDKLIEKLDILRGFVGEPLHVVSGYRCPKYNEKVGGVKLSQHKRSTAADLALPKEMSRSEFNKICKKVFFDGGVGTYPGFTHVDVRGHKARWNRILINV